jgi:hypothetical protein
MQKGMDKIAMLEGLGMKRAEEAIAAEEGQAPEFVSLPTDLTLIENCLAHFEAQLKPVNDASMQVLNNQSLSYIS